MIWVIKLKTGKIQAGKKKTDSQDKTFLLGD